MQRFVYNMSERQAQLIHAQVASHMQALQNWTVSAVERGEWDRAKGLVEEYREYERLYAAFNVDAKRQTADYTGKPLETDITI